MQYRVEDASVRLGVYADELREFFQSRQVAFGSPADLIAFAARVEEPGQFQEEMGSMIRSILFQEDGTLGHGEVLELVSTAVGGPAVETSSPGVQAAIRSILIFVNEALRQGRMGSFEAPMDEQEVTAGDVLAASAASAEYQGIGGRTVVGRSPESGRRGRELDPADQVPVTVEGHKVFRGEPLQGGVLFRAVSMSDADEADEGLRQWEGQRRRWLVPTLVAGVIALVIAGYLARPLLDHSTSSRVAQPAATEFGPTLAPGSCTGAALPGIARSSLTQRSMWAHRLLDQRLYAAALPELKSIAEADPGFPGVYLDESDALLHLKRPEDAREAVDAQMGISECLAKLPRPALDSYCAAEFSVAAGATCRPELARIRQAAQVQAAMVHLDLGHRFESDGSADAAALAKEESAPQVSKPRRVAASPAATEGDNARPFQPRAASTGPGSAGKTNRKAQSDESLMKGEGTDMNYGAYSKPQ